MFGPPVNERKQISLNCSRRFIGLETCLLSVAENVFGLQGWTDAGIADSLNCPHPGKYCFKTASRKPVLLSLPLHIHAHAHTHNSCKSYGSVMTISLMVYHSQLGCPRETALCLFSVVSSGWKVHRCCQPLLLRKGGGGRVLNKYFGAYLH